MNRYTIHRVAVFSMSKAGFLLGALVSLVPSLFCGLSVLIMSRALHRWLGSLRNVEIDGFGMPVSADLISAFHLEALLKQLQTLTRSSPILILALAIPLSLISGFIICLILTLAGWGYNVIARLTGGLVVELKEVEPIDRQMG